VNSYRYKKKQIISGMYRRQTKKKKARAIYTKKKENYIQIHRLINIAKDIVNKRRIKLSGFIELAIAIRHLS